MRYLSVAPGPRNRTVYRFTPPADAKLAGVVVAKEWTSKETAMSEAKRFNLKIDKFREGKLKSGNINVDSPMSVVINWWVQEANPPQFKQDFARTTQKTVGDMSLRDFCEEVTEVYNGWLEKESASSANQKLNALSTMLDFCVSRGLIVSNPAKPIIREPIARYHTVDKKNLWTDEIVHKVVDHCMQDIEKANIGVILLLSSATLQRPGVFVNMTWDCVDLTEEKVEVVVDDKIFSLNPSLSDLMDQQYERYWHQSYIAPKVKVKHPIVGPFSDFGGEVSAIIDELGLDENLDLITFVDFNVKEQILLGEDTLDHIQWKCGMSDERFNRLVDKTKGEVLHLPQKEK